MKTWKLWLSKYTLCQPSKPKLTCPLCCRTSELPWAPAFVSNTVWRSGLISRLSCNYGNLAVTAILEQEGDQFLLSYNHTVTSARLLSNSCIQHYPTHVFLPYLYGKIVCWLLLWWWVPDHSLWAVCTCSQKHGRAGSMETWRSSFILQHWNRLFCLFVCWFVVHILSQATDT